jgi:glutamate dehydrogenase
MTAIHHLRTSAIIDQVVELVNRRVDPDQRTLLENFVRQYYRNSSSEDLEEVEVSDLYGAVLSHWNFARQRKTGAALVRIFNPQHEKHGWQSTHTIVEIVIDDMPFLVDSVRMALNSRGLTTHLVIHPVIGLKRDANGYITEVLELHDPQAASCREAIMQVQVDRQTEKSVLEGLTNDVVDTLEQVVAAVEDWQLMSQRLQQVVEHIRTSPPPIDPSEIKHAQAFLEWVADDHFTFLGCREYRLIDDDELETVGGSGLGLMRNEHGQRVSRSFSSLPKDVRQLAREPKMLLITKSSQRSRVHRPGMLDMIGVKKFNADGEVVGEHRFLGLYTAAAYNNRPSQIPILREKMAYVMQQAGHAPGSHASKALQNIIETFPRDLLFQIGEDELLDSTMGILHLQERQRIRLFVHPDRFGRYYSCLVYVPRDQYETETRRKMQQILVDCFGGCDSEFNVMLNGSVLARLHFVIYLQQGVMVEYDIKKIEHQLREAIRDWDDDLHDALIEGFGEEQGMALFRRYGDAFRSEYCDRYSVRTAVEDVRHMEVLGFGDCTLSMSLYRLLEDPAHLVRFKLFHLEKPVSLSDALPVFENMGLRVEEEHPSKILRSGASLVWMHDFTMTFQGDWEINLDRIRENFQETFWRVWQGEVENDGLNRLVLRAGLDWREIVVLRAYSRYMHQTGTPFSREYIERALSFNHEITAQLVELFQKRFDPAGRRPSARELQGRVTTIETALDAVSSLDEDRILRSFLALIQATLRSNHYQTDDQGAMKPYLAFKFDPSRVPDLPEPCPMFEIFVYSTRVEGVHLRGGPVARGGLRWSDRREDFRTEVLGLVKAQMVKNAVIVPVGSKGGFFPKLLPIGADREAIQAEGIACYKVFIRGLLDLTDNLVSGKVVPPEQLVRYDGDDPYLVVAADKGTATFSDIANQISQEYGYWLGDAFASGGSQGYDHKAMGITARGAWESVKRHFSELGLNTQAEEFSVVGIGDMSGDVFGNGMLLSPHIRLVAAFNHLHIFLDPEPDADASFTERKRLFAQPRSSWTDYDPKLISQGGGVFARSDKSIAVSPEMRKVLDINRSKLTPNELIQALLCAPVDLLWNGGIGTYVKASSQHHNDVGDRANDGVRINANQLRCRVIGEGGNLGLTQLARIEFAASGGRIYTDAIDNSAGVDCSDHEVNIKILLNEVVQNQDMTEKQRNRQLADMTDEVARLVLRDNYLQTQALSLSASQAPALLDAHTRLMRHLEVEGILDPQIEYLPGKEEVDERLIATQGLTSPELSVLLAYVKNNLFQQILQSGLPDDAFFIEQLIEYFPQPLRARFSTQMQHHRLHREIISTVVTNDLVNRAGISFMFRLHEETGASAESIARAYAVARQAYSMHQTWREIEALDNHVAAQVQIGMLLEGRKLVERSARWLLRNRPQPIDIAYEVAHFSPGIENLMSILPTLMPISMLENVEVKQNQLLDDQVPPELARKVALFSDILSALDIVEVASGLDLDYEMVARVYMAVGERLEFYWLRNQATLLPRANRWQALSRSALRADLFNQHRILTGEVLAQTEARGEAAQRVEQWFAQNATQVQRSRQVLADIKTAGEADFNMLSVAMQEIRTMVSVAVPRDRAGGSAKKRKTSRPKVSTARDGKRARRVKKADK